ncbi:MAG: hypothetical protein IPO67_11320 [Deltaproteobacteria bacterium]|nr:hypothetical protein [Deltaproteobacteria bacterium]
MRALTLVLVLSACREDTLPPPVEGQTPGDCSDGADNDVDGLFDCEDSGCKGAAECAPEDTAPPEDTSPPQDTAPQTFGVALEWTDEALLVKIYNSDEPEWRFGMYSQDGLSPYPTESCVGITFCHLLGPDGGEILYTTNLEQVGPGYTLFRRSWETHSAFILRGTGDRCYVWGVKRDYFDAEGCEELTVD